VVIGQLADSSARACQALGLSPEGDSFVPDITCASVTGAFRYYECRDYMSLLDSLHVPHDSPPNHIISAFCHAT